MASNDLPPVHPGDFLREILEELNFTQVAFAQVIAVSPMRVSHVLKGSRPITAELALRIGRALGQSPDYWLNLQNRYDLKVAQTQWQDSLLNVKEIKFG